MAESMVETKTDAAGSQDKGAYENLLGMMGAANTEQAISICLRAVAGCTTQGFISQDEARTLTAKGLKKKVQLQMGSM